MISSLAVWGGWKKAKREKGEAANPRTTEDENVLDLNKAAVEGQVNMKRKYLKYKYRKSALQQGVHLNHV